MILITGAAGKTGRAALRALARRGEPVRALVRQPAQADLARAAGAVDVVAGDLRDPAVVRGAVQGARAVYHICPNMAPDEVALGRALLAAARAAGVAHIVYHSVLHPQTEAMPHHWNKLRVEEAVFESGLAFTILQPAPYLQNLLAYWESITTRGVFAVPYPPETRLSLVDLEEVGQVAALALTEPGHRGATYELCGTAGLTQTETAAALSAGLEQPVRVEQADLGEWERGARAAGLSPYAVDTLLKMFRYYAEFGLWGSPRALTALLGRAPAGPAEFALRQRPSSGPRAAPPRD
ncbi:MAG: NmrA family NAD(P)-binding protein [Anaerolineales bacterium]|nr:NmrA family NAD(P)-binding protein [Anaerolineales bacterium]